VRRLAAALLTLAFACLALPARAGDPYLRWYTIDTPHFRIHFHSGLEPVAQRIATLGEGIHRRLVPHLGWEPTEITEIVLTDDTDSANGSAGVIPYNQVRMFASAPDDMSPLADYEDWTLELLTHEYTHILHVDNLSGLPAILNAVLGKTYAPNQTQPRWILEGLAVAMESRHTAAGRLRSTQFDMYLRADVLEDNLAELDQISNPSRRWPGGNLWYLYGSKFIEWIADVYGPETFAAVATDYGANIIPWGINRSIRRATGRTYPELYRGWRYHLKRRYEAQAQAVRRRGLREGKRLTHHGQVAQSPRFVPACARASEREELVYFRDDGHETAGIYRLPLAPSRDASFEDDSEIVARAGGRVGGFDAECGLVFENTAPSRRRYYFGDLFRQPAGTRSPRGTEKSRQRLSTGRRLRDPDVSPDGRRVVYVTNESGTTTLRSAELSPELGLKSERRLVPSARFEQAYTPRFSPDGRRVAYSAWSRGGYRDVRVVDFDSGRFIEISHDRAIDQQPTFTPDGRFVVFTSDRTGIPNVYAYELSTRRLSQVTNVINGAYMPELSSDGRTLVYVGYTSEGFDLFSMPFDPARFLPALPYLDDRPHPLPDPDTRHWAVTPYNPWPTLVPRAYEIELFTNAGRFGGDALRLSTNASDAVGIHAFAASVTLEFEDSSRADFADPVEPIAALDYVYRRLPFDLRASVFRSAAPRRGFRISDREPLFIERQTGVTTGVSYTMPGEFDAQSLSLSYTAAEFHGELPVGPNLDPFATVTRVPHQGFISTVHLGYSYSNAEGSAWGISTEKGFSIGLAADFADEVTGSESTLTSFFGTATAYVPMPWLRHHVLALGAQAGAAVGTYPRRGLFVVGGYTDQSVGELIDAFETGIRQGSFVLRGYEPAQFIGTQFNLLKAEYRFPLLYVDRGLSTLPVFMRGLSGALFADYGGAYDRMDLDDPLAVYHLGLGGELWLDLVLGYFARGNLRWGIAKGMDDEAPDLQTYLVISSAF
jgi:hypothetical protein